MSDHDFVFTLRLADDAGWDEMVDDLTTSVLRHVGFAPSVLEELAGLVRAGFETGRASHAEYDLQFRVREGEIEIVVLRDELTVFHTSRRLP